MTPQQKPLPNSTDGQTDKEADSVKTSPTPGPNLLKTARERIEVPPPGLMLAGYRDKVIEDDYIAAMHEQLRTAGRKTGVPMPQIKHLHALYSGPRDMQRAKALASMETSPKSAAPSTVHSFGSRAPFDFGSEEGSHALRAFIEQNRECAITAKVELRSHDPRLGERLLRIDMAAQNAQAYVMLFVDQSESAADASLQHFADECFESDICDPNPNARISFSIAATRLAHLYRYGIGKVLVSVNWGAEGYTRQYEPFVSASLKHRFAWLLAGAGESYEQAAQRFGVNKTTIMRWLQKLPPTRSKPIAEELIQSYLEAIDVMEIRDDSAMMPAQA
ncbi:helix-turn-helix domain-containing protein [Paraburkholderia tropica]|uniref:helix-turn-helix domain-containing protein n=1 Tax=Paraburkholderia tropica TaxID=92647 RepID=UPI002ABE6BDC|nr:helix-turn-helix domain-containing protein [Paraburkholderia tropica]